MWKFQNKIIKEVESYDSIDRIRPSNFRMPLLNVKQKKYTPDLKREFDFQSPFDLHSLSLNINQQHFLAAHGVGVILFDIE